MNSWENMRARHSVRTYTGEPLAADVREKLEAFIADINEQSGLAIQLLENDPDVFSGISKKFCGWSGIRSYVALVGPDTDELGEQVGYYGEQIVLYAQTLGLNTCWAGLFKRKNARPTIEDGQKLVLVIAIGYGTHAGKPHTSKAFDEVSKVAGEVPEWFEKGVEAALLAPTAMNQQAFLFELLEDGSVKASTSKGAFKQVDLGIAKYHFEIGSGYKF